MSRALKILLFSVLTILIIIITVTLIINFNQKKVDEKKVTIITTLFPTYDFARNIAGDLADVTLLISPGTESHSYEPSINDIASISNSTLFVYTGVDLEPWTKNVLDSVNNQLKSVNVAKSINLQNNLDDDDDLKYDPHIWMSIKNSKIMCENIYNALCEVDKENSNIYTQNYKNYIVKLNELENKYISLNNNKSNKLIFASPFAYSYLTEEYNLDYISAYGFCSEANEPSVNDMKNVIEYIKNSNSKYILCDKLFSKNTAKTISNETGTTVLDFNSIHNISKDDLENGTGYIELMKENLDKINLILE